jgi:hypothetical protein
MVVDSLGGRERSFHSVSLSAASPPYLLGYYRLCKSIDRQTFLVMAPTEIRRCPPPPGGWSGGGAFKLSPLGPPGFTGDPPPPRYISRSAIMTLVEKGEGEKEKKN